MRKHADVDLGERIRQRRKALGLSQEEAGLFAGVGRVFVSQAERGKTTLRLDKLIALLDALGLHLEIRNGAGGLIVAETDAPYSA